MRRDGVDGRGNDFYCRCRQPHRGRRRSPPSTSEPEVDPRWVWVGQLRHETSVDEGQAAPDRRVVEVMTTWRRRSSTVMTWDDVCRVAGVRASSSTYS